MTQTDSACKYNVNGYSAHDCLSPRKETFFRGPGNTEVSVDHITLVALYLPDSFALLHLPEVPPNKTGIIISTSRNGQLKTDVLILYRHNSINMLLSGNLIHD